MKDGQAKQNYRDDVWLLDIDIKSTKAFMHWAYCRDEERKIVESSLVHGQLCKRNVCTIPVLCKKRKKKNNKDETERTAGGERQVDCTITQNYWQ
jgi:hypothetical protein